jgi:outer membrane protein OmpA-like peptidoglycan-associated protein
LVGSDIQDAILTSTPALTMGLEAGGFLLALRYGRLDRPIGLPGPAARASEVLVPLFRAVWPILALVPATLGFALLGAEMKANHYGSTDFGRASFTVAFDNGSTTLPKSADQTLQEAAAAIKAPENRLVVTGYADRDTPSSAEQRLAEGRATVVRDALVARGVPRDAITVRAFAAQQDSNSGRVEIVVSLPAGRDQTPVQGTPVQSAPQPPPAQQQTVPSKK